MSVIADLSQDDLGITMLRDKFRNPPAELGELELAAQGFADSISLTFQDRGHFSARCLLLSVQLFALLK
jgi:hypothetical protein